MVNCDICGTHPSGPDGYCSGCRICHRLLKVVAEVPSNIKSWAEDRVRIVTSEIQEECQKLKLTKRKEEQLRKAPRAGSESRTPRAGSEQVKKEEDKEELPVAEAKVIEEETEAEKTSKKREKSPSKRRRRSKKEKKDKRKDSSAGEKETPRKAASSAGREKEKKSAEGREKGRTSEGKKERASENTVEKKPERAEEKKERKRESRSPSVRRGRTGGAKLRSRSPLPGSSRPPEPSKSPRRGDRTPTPPPGRWEDWYHWERDKSPKYWKNKGKKKVVRQHYRRQYSW